MPGLTCDRKVVRNDIKLAAKIITNLDNKWGLWQRDNKEDVIGKAEISSTYLYVIIGKLTELTVMIDVHKKTF